MSMAGRISTPSPSPPLRVTVGVGGGLCKAARRFGVAGRRVHWVSDARHPHQGEGDVVRAQRFAALAAALALGVAAPAGAAEEGMRPLFNGKDLAGWVNVNCAPGTFFVRDNLIVTTGK